MGGFDAVAFEILHQSQAPALARHLDQSETPEVLAEGLGRAVNWQRWPSWRQNYRQIAEVALASAMTIVAGNAENTVLRQAVNLGPGALEKAFVARTKFEVPLVPAALEGLNAELTDSPTAAWIPPPSPAWSPPNGYGIHPWPMPWSKRAGRF